MLAALDSNVLIYAEGLNDDARRDTAQAHILALGPGRIVIPVQALGEMLLAQLRIAKRDAAYAAHRAREWSRRHVLQETTQDVFDDALIIMERHGLRVWDAIILAAAEAASATVLLSEDMQNGFRWRNVTIVNPFSVTPESLLAFMSISTRH
jgi:predicted nucleic acid-binding protein